MKKSIYYCFLFSFSLWLIFFLIRIVIGNIVLKENVESNPDISVKNTTIVERVISSLEENDRNSAFLIIFRNNIRGTIINILGGVMLGLGTVVNLATNGFFSSDVFVSSYYSGMTVQQILAVTLPHSFELIGFWLSGALGLWIAWNIVQLIRGRESFTRMFYKQLFLLSFVAFFLILAAAFVEAYISICGII